MLGGNLAAYDNYVRSIVAANANATAAMTASGMGASGVAPTTTTSTSAPKSTYTPVTPVGAGKTATITNPMGGTSTVQSGGVMDWFAQKLANATNWVNSRVSWNAKGGSFIANKPTIQGFGDAGPELVTAIPLGRLGKGSGSGGGLEGLLGGGGGNITINLDLSPDLESRIVSNTLSETARVMVRTRNSK
jgi:hypothetical protein